MLTKTRLIFAFNYGFIQCATSYTKTSEIYYVLVHKEYGIYSFTFHEGHILNDMLYIACWLFFSELQPRTLEVVWHQLIYIWPCLGKVWFFLSEHHFVMVCKAVLIIFVYHIYEKNIKILTIKLITIVRLYKFNLLTCLIMYCIFIIYESLKSFTFNFLNFSLEYFEKLSVNIELLRVMEPSVSPQISEWMISGKLFLWVLNVLYLTAAIWPTC